MARMTAAQAAVSILKAEGATHLFGLPGAAINPFYKAMQLDGGLHHTLARHVRLSQVAAVCLGLLAVVLTPWAIRPCIRDARSAD